MGARTWSLVGFVLLPLAAGCGMRSAVEADVADEGGSEGEGGSSSAERPACGAGVTPCDVDDVSGRTCESLGMGTGPVTCNAADCTYDTSQCVLPEDDMGGAMGPIGGTGMDMPMGGTSGAMSGSGGEESNPLLDLLEALLGGATPDEEEEGDEPQPEEEEEEEEGSGSQSDAGSPPLSAEGADAAVSPAD